MISKEAKIYRGIIRIIKPKNYVHKILSKAKRSKKDFVPKKIARDFLVASVQIAGRSVVTIQAKKGSTNKHVIFLHGGAYVVETLYLHWLAARDIIKQSSCKLTIIDYPLAPENNFTDTFAMLQESYAQLIADHPGDEFILMGDSAGGGLALAFLQKLRDEKAKIIPQRTILFSPWLDMVMDNDEIREMQEKEMYLTIPALAAAAERYSRGADLQQPLLSPINGAMNDLGELLVFVGTHELFLPDCRKLKMKVEETNTRIRLHEYPLMHHDWLLFRIPETKQAIQEICAFIEED